MRGLYALCFAGLLLVSPLRIEVALSFPGGEVDGYSAEMLDATPASESESMDLNADGIDECMHLSANRVSISGCQGADQSVYWQSPESWKVLQWTFSDLNHDGQPEVTLLVWRDFMPWPIEREQPDGGRIGSFHDAQGKSCHVILIGWKKDAFTEVWAGSALANPALSILAADIDGDGAEELLTIESDYHQSAMLRSGPIAVWKWNGFGFDLNQRVDGSYRHMILLDHPQQWIIASQ